MSADASQAAPVLPERRRAPARPHRRQRVKVPWRLVSAAHYSDAALAVYIKVAALAARPEGCTAKVAVIAEYLGMSKSAVERGLRELNRPGPDGISEAVSERRTLRGGTGTSALRRVRQLDEDELFVWLPVAAAEALTPRQLRAYAILAYATIRRIPLAASDLAEMLHHHTGDCAGQPLDERSARRLTDDLETLGWIDVARRAGHQGRHAYTVHDAPLHVVDADTHDGSGLDDHAGSLASKEDHPTDRRDKTQPGGAIRRRRDDRSNPVDTAGTPLRDSLGRPGRALRADTAAAPRPPYTGPALTLAPRIWDVLEPVRPLLPGIGAYPMRQIAREIGRQLNTGTDPERLRARLQHRYACTEPIRDPGRWLLGAGLPRRGCGLGDCESGVIWRTGMRCEVCADISAARRPSATDAPPPPPPGAPPDTPAPRPRPVWHECATCRAPSRIPLTDGLCTTCRTTRAA